METETASATQTAPGASRNATRLAVFVVLAAFLFTHLFFRITPWFPTDDSYISFRYADNLAAGQGMVFNPGERVEGYSNFLFVVVLAGARTLGVTPPLAARLLNSAAVLVVLLLLLSRATDRWAPLWMRGLAAAVVVVSPHTVVNVLSGLEAPLAAAILLAAAIAVEGGRRAVAVPLFLLFALTRPEGVVFATAAMGIDLLRTLLRNDATSFWRALRTWSVGLAAPYAIFMAWRFFYYGTFVPNSITAKSGIPLAESVQRSWPYLKIGLEYYWPLLVLVAAGWVARRRWRLELPVVSALLAGSAAMYLVIGCGDPYRTFIRYLYPFLLLLLLAAAIGAWRVIQRLAGNKPAWRFAGYAALAVVVVLQLWSVSRATPGTYRSPLTVVAKTVQGAGEFVAQDVAPHAYEIRGLGLGLHSLAAWLVANSSGDEVLATAEVGIVPYYSRLCTVDTAGLVDRHIAHLSGSPGFKQDADYVFAREPDFFAFKKLVRCLCGGLPADASLFRDPRLRRHYDFVRAFPDGGRTILLFARRRSHEREVVLDLTEAFSHGRVVAVHDGGSVVTADAVPLARAQAFTGTGVVNPVSAAERQELLDELGPTIRGQGEDYAAASLIRRWLGQWQPFLLHVPTELEAEIGIVYPVTIPAEARLHFAYGIAADPRDPADGRGQRFEVLIRSVGGEAATVFSKAVSPHEVAADAGWHDAEVDLSSFAGSEAQIVLRSFYDEPGTVRSIHRAGWLGMQLVRGE